MTPRSCPRTHQLLAVTLLILRALGCGLWGSGLDSFGPGYGQVAGCCEQGTEPSSRIKQTYKNRGPPPWRRNFVRWRPIFANTLYGTSLLAFPAIRILRWVSHFWKICRPLPLRTENFLIIRWTTCLFIRLHSFEMVSQLIIYFASQIRLFYKFVAFIWQRKGKSSSHLAIQQAAI